MPATVPAQRGGLAGQLKSVDNQKGYPQISLAQLAAAATGLASELLDPLDEDFESAVLVGLSEEEDFDESVVLPLVDFVSRLSVR